MNTILLQPTDVFFFRDGRPMGGSLSGHGAAWPFPTVVSLAFHAALHRAGDELSGVHTHRRGRSGNYGEQRDRKFGCLRTAGPFPVSKDGETSQWFFPRPIDAGVEGSAEPSFLPLSIEALPGNSSLPGMLDFPVANTELPTKKTPESWLSGEAYRHYLGTGDAKNLPLGPDDFKNDSSFADTEFNYGIGIDPDKGTQDGERFYSASYLRLRDNWRMGVLAEAIDKDFRHSDYGADLVRTLLNGNGTEIIAGGQQRVCTAEMDSSPRKELPLPVGKSEGFHHENDKWLVKWTLLSPAIWPEISGNEKKDIHPHSGGWLPNWIAEHDCTLDGEDIEKGSVLLLDGPGRKKVGRKGGTVGKRIDARLVAAMMDKPVPITGYALAGTHREKSGPRSTHLAVPAGSVYYFMAGSETAAKNLASALNWHGNGDATQIRHSRSTVMGEKGFGLGVCSSWKLHNGERPATET